METRCHSGVVEVGILSCQIRYSIGHSHHCSYPTHDFYNFTTRGSPLLLIATFLFPMFEYFVVTLTAVTGLQVFIV